MAKDDNEVNRPGEDSLWHWFGLGRDTFAVMPRVMMHAMPDDWQGKMAALLVEYERAFPGLADLPNASVQARSDGRFTKWPSWLLNYRRPDRDQINALREWL